MKRMMMLVCAYAVAAGMAFGVQVNWINDTGSGLLEDPDNWVQRYSWDGTWDHGVQIPGPIDTVNFFLDDLETDLTVTSDEMAVTNGNVNVSGAYSFTIDLKPDAVWQSAGQYGAFRFSSAHTLLSCGTLEATTPETRYGVLVGLGVDGCSMLVTGTQSVLTARGRVGVGSDGGNWNSLIVSNGASIINTIVSVGSLSDARGGSSNTLLVIEGGIISNASIQVAQSGGRENVLTIGKGGKYISENYYGGMGVGRYGGADNTIEVCDGGKVDLYRGSFFLEGTGNRIIVTGLGSSITSTNGGNGSVGAWNGVNDIGNTLEIRNGGEVVVQQKISTGGNGGNGIIVSDTGSLLESTNREGDAGYITVNGNSSFLTVTNKGQVITGHGLYIGNGVGQVSNLVLVTGTGSLLRPRATLQVGVNGGCDNELRIEDGGAVEVDFTYEGYYWYDTIIGQGGGSRNRIVVNPGSTFTNSNANWGVSIGKGGDDNEIIVNGGDFWTEVGLPVGAAANAKRNRFEVKNGGTAEVRSLSLGSEAGADENVIRVAGGGTLSTRMHHNGLNIGLAGASNRLEVADGGEVTVYVQSERVRLGTPGVTTCFGNVLCVSNGTFALWPSTGNTPDYARGLIVAAGGRVEIAGNDSLLRSEMGLEMYESSVLRYELGKTEPPNRALVQLKGNPYGNYWATPCFGNDGTTKLEIDAKALALAGGGRVILMETYKPCTVALEDLIASVDWGKDGIACKLGIIPNGVLTFQNEEGSLLVCDVPSMAGTMILLR